MLNILVVDDSGFMAKAMKSVLEGMGFNVVALAHDGVQGLEQFSLHRPDVTLLDITMPNMDGLECLGKIRELDSDARVVMLSAVQDEETVAQCMEAGAVSFLQKPIRKNNAEDLNRLQTTIENAAQKVG